jgi:hypothetical protein
MAPMTLTPDRRTTVMWAWLVCVGRERSVIVPV